MNHPTFFSFFFFQYLSFFTRCFASSYIRFRRGGSYWHFQRHLKAFEMCVKEGNLGIDTVDAKTFPPPDLLYIHKHLIESC